VIDFGLPNVALVQGPPITHDEERENPRRTLSDRRLFDRGQIRGGETYFLVTRRLLTGARISARRSARNKPRMTMRARWSRSSPMH
jgi:hypothetical protein